MFSPKVLVSEYSCRSILDYLLYNLTAPDLVPYFNGDGRYLHAVIALGMEKAGDRSFYLGIMEDIQSDVHTSKSNCIQETQEQGLSNDNMDRHGI